MPWTEADPAPTASWSSQQTANSLSAFQNDAFQSGAFQMGSSSGGWAEQEALSNVWSSS